MISNVYLEERLVLAGVGVGDVLAPAQERVLLAHLQVVQVHEPAQEHTLTNEQIYTLILNT